MSDRLARTARELRDEVERLIGDALVGPVGGEAEELPLAPVAASLLGLLAPRLSHERGAPPRANDEDDNAAAEELPEDGLATGGVTADSGEEGTAEDRP